MVGAAGLKAPLPLFRYAHPGLEARGFQKQSGASTWGRWRDELAATRGKASGLNGRPFEAPFEAGWGGGLRSVEMTGKRKDKSRSLTTVRDKFQSKGARAG